jgi:hypothetical protein
MDKNACQTYRANYNHKLFEKDLPFDYAHYSDRSLTQVARKETEAGEIYTEKMSDLHAYQIATSKDVYIYDSSNGRLWSR